jgi:hypothetical protein
MPEEVVVGEFVIGGRYFWWATHTVVKTEYHTVRSHTFTPGLPTMEELRANGVHVFWIDGGDGWSWYTETESDSPFFPTFRATAWDAKHTLLAKGLWKEMP